MTAGLGLVALGIAAATATLLLIIREMHLRALDTRVSNAVLGIPSKSAPSRDMIGWFSSIGMRYRRFARFVDFEHHQPCPRAMLMARARKSSRNLSR